MNQEFIKRILSSIILFPIALFFIIEGSFLFNFFILLCFAITSLEWYRMSKKKPYNFFGSIFLIISFYSIYKLRNEFNSEHMYLLFITIICVSTDIGGYLFGKLFKGPKLTKISPKKTYSGMIGGYLMSIIAVNFFINSAYSNELIDLTNNTYVFVLLVSSISQLGDILISYLKDYQKLKIPAKLYLVMEVF